MGGAVGPPPPPLVMVHAFPGSAPCGACGALLVVPVRLSDLHGTFDDWFKLISIAPPSPVVVVPVNPCGVHITFAYHIITFVAAQSSYHKLK